MRVRRDHDHPPILTRARDRLPQACRAGVVEIRERFVQKEERDPLGFDARKGRAPALSCRKPLDRAIHLLADAPRAKRAVDPSRVAAAEADEEFQVLSGGEAAEHHRPMADIEDVARYLSITPREGKEAGE